MSFLTPWFLLGGLAVGIPIWVHLIRRQQSEPSPLPSLMFYRRLPVRTMSRQQLQHLLLLAARCLLILLLALAFARPFFTSANPVAMAAKSRLYVILVDVSGSMRYGDRAARAQAAAREALGKLSALDEAQLVSFDAEAHILNPPSNDRGVLSALVDTELKPGALPTRYAAAFTAVEKIARTATLPVSAVLITDSQKSGWTAGNEMPHVPLTWIGIDDKPHPNWAVADVRIAHDTYQSKYPRGVQARVNGFGTPAAQREILFLLNGREIQRRKVQVPASGSVAVSFDGFELPLGVSRGEVRMTPADDLSFDDAVYFTIQRREPYKLLFVSGGGDRPLVYFRQALGAGEDPAFAIETSGPLRQFSAVILVNASSAPPHLREFVEKGGGLLVAPGDRTDWSSLASALGPLLPASGGEKTYVRRDGDQFITFGDFQRDHVLFQPFAGPAAAGLLAARFFGYFRVKADAGVLARFSNGDPAVVEKAVGQGRVLLLASAPDNVWSDFPIRPGFVPFVKQAARYLARLPDEPAYYTVPATASLGTAATVMNPHGKRLYEELKEGSSFAKLDEIGFYEVRRQGQSAYLAANADPRESDLTPFSAEDRALLTQKSPTTAQAAAVAASDAKPTREEQEQRQNLWWTVLGIATLLVVLESFAGNGILRLPRSEEQP
jgi:hypothetical protein